MFNSIEFYQSLGAKVADRRNHSDKAGARFHKEHYQRARNLEASSEDRRAAEKAYEKGYSEERRVPCSSL